MSSADAERVADIGSSQADLDASADRYANRFRGKSGAWLLCRQTAAVHNLVEPDRGASVIDVGGGHSKIATLLLAEGHAVTVHASADAALGQVRQLYQLDR